MNSSTRDLAFFALLGLFSFGLYVALEVALVGLIMRGPMEWMYPMRALVDALPWVTYAGLAVLAVARRRWRPLAAFAGAQVLGIVALFAFLIARPIVSDYATRIPFDSSVWQAESQERTGVRVRMVDDLLRRHHLQGMTTAEIDHLLGVPPPSTMFPEHDRVYWLGPERGFFSIDSEWLVIESTRGVVISARIVTD